MDSIKMSSVIAPIDVFLVLAFHLDWDMTAFRCLARSDRDAFPRLLELEVEIVASSGLLLIAALP
jgi:hypothetical protein